MNDFYSLRDNPYDFLAEKYDDLFDFNPFYENVSRAEMEVFDSYISPAKNGERALDIGCGTGYHTSLLVERGYKTTAVDKSLPMLNVARFNATELSIDADYLCLNAESLDTLDANYRVAICLGSTINHISNFGKLFACLRSKLELNGVFIFSFDNILGIDSLFWIFKRKISGYQTSERIERFIENLKAVISSKPFKNDWRLKTPMGIFPLRLHYYRFSKIRNLLKENGFTVDKRVGANLATCFVPRILNSSTEILADGQGLDEIPNSLSDLDRILGRLLPSLCANTIVACRAV